MNAFDNNDRSISTDADAFYEAVARQEEIYLEETEEELRMILESDDLPYLRRGNLNEQRECAVEDVMAGDSDDSPLSELRVDEMLD